MLSSATALPPEVHVSSGVTPIARTLHLMRRAPAFTLLRVTCWAIGGLFCAGVTGGNLSAAERAVPRFEAEVLDDQVQIGYGTAIGDVDGDGRPDILLADKRQFVWYRNPDWRKFVIVENLTALDNVCIAARDLDGDGRVEIAVGALWNPGDTLNSGSVHYLQPPEDRRQVWKPIALPNEPVVHRMRWVRTGEQSFALVVSPLHGRGNRNGEGAGVKLIAYDFPPADQREQPERWKQTVIEDSLHVTHNLDPIQWTSHTPAEELLYIGREGAMLLAVDVEGTWSKRRFQRIEGGGEIRLGRLSASSPLGSYIATIEPLHGDRLVCYPVHRETGEPANRIVLDDAYNGGHAIACGDLIGDGRGQQIVAGWRLPNAQKLVGLKFYWPLDDQATRWDSTWIDQNGMATEDVRLADLDGDGRLDVVAAGRATHNLKVYWNRAK